MFSSNFFHPNAAPGQLLIQSQVPQVSSSVPCPASSGSELPPRRTQNTSRDFTKRKRKKKTIKFSLKATFKPRTQALPSSSQPGVGAALWQHSAGQHSTEVLHGAQPSRPIAARTMCSARTEATRLKVANDRTVGIFTFPMPYRAH